MKKLLFWFLAALLFQAAIGCAGKEEKSITVFAAANSKAAIEEAGSTFEEKTGIIVYLNFGGSGTLLSQMSLSKSGDVYIPASPDYITKAGSANVIYPDSEVRLAYLIPAILVQNDNPDNIKSLADLARPGLKIAISDPKTVPAGLYAYEIMDYNGLLKDIGNNIVTYGENYDKTTSYVILKSVDASIGWDILARQQPDVLDAVYLLPEQLPRVSYMSGAVSTYTLDRDSAQDFLDFLVSSAGQDIFKKWGYITTERDARNFAPNARIGGEYQLPADYQAAINQ
jgi:molybdate transport system substrate-binding protein